MTIDQQIETFLDALEQYEKDAMEEEAQLVKNHKEKNKGRKHVNYASFRSNHSLFKRHNLIKGKLATRPSLHRYFG